MVQIHYYYKSIFKYIEVLSKFKSKNICMLQMKKQDCLHDYGL